MGAHALLIGVSHFEDPKLAKLNSPQSDVIAFANVLKDPGRGGFDSVTTSIDQDLLTMRDQLSTLLDGRSADDMVLLYYSGHGIVAKGQRLYLATGQSSFDKPQARSLATSEVRDMMEQSRAGKMVVILDCCHSGVFAEGAKGNAATVTEDTFGSGDGAEGQYVLTASNALQYAYDGAGALKEGKAGPVLSRFTSWLVEGLGQGQASPYDEQITLDTLYQYLCKRARDEGDGMTPQRFVKRGSGDIVIAKNPQAKPLSLPDDLVAKLDSPDWKVRKAAVEELTKVAKQPRMAPLAKKAVLDRVSDERDVDVREGMTQLLLKLGGGGASPEPPPVTPEPEVVEPKKPKQKHAKPAPEPQPEWKHPQPPPAPEWSRPPPYPVPPPITLPALDDWQTKVLVKSGVSTASLTGPNGPYLLMELQRRANGLRIATQMSRVYPIVVSFFALGAIGMVESGDGDSAALITMIMIGFGIWGLVNRRQLPLGPHQPGDPDMARLKEAVPLIQSIWGWGFGLSKREYEAKHYHRACLWMLIAGVVSLFGVAIQL